MTEYTAKELTKEARAAVKGLGTYLGWKLHIHVRGYVALIARFRAKNGEEQSISIAI